MAAQLAMPAPMKQMLDYLNIDIDLACEALPEDMEDAMQTCLTCKALDICEDDMESLYFRCPNRGLFDVLAKLQGRN